MVKGRNNAMVATLVVVVSLLVLHCDLVQAKTYVVGGKSGWTYGVQTWPYGKKFKSGDILVFYYNPTDHNVVYASKKEYDSCNLSNPSKVYNTGKDRITLRTGPNYFISSYTGQCSAGLKLFVLAA